MKYAIIETNGKQYMVKKGDKITIDPDKPLSDTNSDTDTKEQDEEKISFSKVLLIGEKTEDANDDKESGKAVIGEPNVSGASVEGRILDRYKAKKVIAFKYKRRKGYHRKTGFRPHKMDVEITAING